MINTLRITLAAIRRNLTYIWLRAFIDAYPLTSMENLRDSDVPEQKRNKRIINQIIKPASSESGKDLRLSMINPHAKIQVFAIIRKLRFDGTPETIKKSPLRKWQRTLFDIDLFNSPQAW